MPAVTTTDAGEAMFARYAYPPNELGYCGSGDGRDLLEFADSRPDRSTGALDMVERARTFDGAWPYLQYLAAVSGAGSVMDQRVVEAYWIGNDLLTGGDPESFATAVRTAFAGQRGTDLDALHARPVPVAHHSFHVFSVYPWVGVLRRTGAPQALQVLNRCRIRWGQVEAVDETEFQVRSRPLSWDGATLSLGDPAVERARHSADGRSLTATVREGDWVALHWDWVCDRLSAGQLTALRTFTDRQLAITNRGVTP